MGAVQTSVIIWGVTVYNIMINEYNTSDDTYLAGARSIIKVSGHQYQWLAGGYDLEIGIFRSG